MLLLIDDLPDLVIADGSVHLRVLSTSYPRVDHLICALDYGLRVPRLLVSTVAICASHIRPIGGLLSPVDAEADAVVRHGAHWVESMHSLGGGAAAEAFCASSEEGLVAL